MSEALLGNVMVDCGDAEELQRFYGELLGWEQCRMFGCRAVRSSGGTVFLFAGEEDYVPPVWPEEEGRQQKQMHFDFQVESVPEAVRRAEALGAVKARTQFGGEDFVTMLDPAGHPFCLCWKSETMEAERIIQELWQAGADQDEEALARFFTPDAEIFWPNTGERFDLAGYLRANCDYPGQWRGEMEKVAADGSYSIARVWSQEGEAARAVTFYQWKNGKIVQMTEYWGDIGPVPEWRKGLGETCGYGCDLPV